MKINFELPELNELKLESTKICLSEDIVNDDYIIEEGGYVTDPCYWSFADINESADRVEEWTAPYTLSNGWMILFVDPEISYLHVIMEIGGKKIYFDVHLGNNESGNRSVAVMRDSGIVKNHDDLEEIWSAFEGFLWDWHPVDRFIMH
jgi:hypothetical protein